MFKPLFSKDLKPLNKICLSGVLIALTIIFQKIVAINYISFIPFVRISFGGPALIILTSIWLGPFYGMAVGLFSDLFGYLLFDPKSFSFFPQISLIYMLLGFASYFIFKIVFKMKSIKLLYIIQTLLFVSLFAASTIFLLLNDDITLYSSSYHLFPFHKAIILSILAVLFLFISLFSYLYSKKNKRLKFNPIQLSFALFIIELLVMVLFSSIMKGTAFGFQTYGIILLSQILILFFDVPFNTILLTMFIKVIEPSKLN